MTDIDVGVYSVSPDTHLFPTGNDYMLRHVGWWAVGFAVTPPGPEIGSPQFDIAYWRYIEFAVADIWFPPEVAALPCDSLLWNIAAGCSCYLNVSG